MRVARIIGVVSILIKISVILYALDTFMENPYVVIPLILSIITYYYAFFKRSRYSCLLFTIIGLYYLLVPLFLESGFNISIIYGTLAIVAGIMAYNYLDKEVKALEKSMM